MNHHIEATGFTTVSPMPGTGIPEAGRRIAARLQGVTKDYKLDKVKVRALSGIDCEIAQGETSFVIGPSGSGKSTFLNILGLVDQPSTGQLTLLDRDVTKLGDNEAADFRSRHIGFIFQSFNLIPVLSLRENVEFPLHRHNLSASERRDRAETYLKAVGLGDMMKRRPGEISGGQRQRVAVARALVSQPDLIIADEPTANLDTRTSAEIIALLGRMQADFDTTIVICTHEMNLIPARAPVIEIVDGRVV